MALVEPPYPPKPRLVPLELGRRADGPVVHHVACLLAHILGILLFVIAPLAMAWLAVTFLRETSVHVAWRLVGFIVFMSLALVYMKSLLPRRIPLPPAVIPVTPDEQPVAYAFIERVAADLSARPPRRLWLGSGVELALSRRVSVIHLIASARSDIVVGLWLWQTLTLSELQAALARTIAPLGGSQLNRLRYSVRALLDGLVSGSDMIDEAADSDSPLAGMVRFGCRCHAMAVFPLRMLGRPILALTANERATLTDDLAAVPIAGSDAVVHAILRGDFAGATLRDLDDLLNRSADVGMRTRDLYAHSAAAAQRLYEAHNDFNLGQAPSLRGPNAGKYADVFEPGKQYLSKMWQGMSPPTDREQNAKRTFVAAERDERPALILLDEQASLQERLTNLRYLEVLAAPDDGLPFEPAVMSRWLTCDGKSALDKRYVGCYDDCRPIQPGTTAELHAALSGETWDHGRLLATADDLYARAGQRAASWLASRAALDKVLRRTLFRPSGRDRAIAEDLHDDVRKATRWLNALDRWAYVVHIHMAARLPDLELHEQLLAQYERVEQFQSLAADARDFRNRLAAYVRQLEHFVDGPPPRLAKEARKEFKASMKDLDLLLSDAGELNPDTFAHLTGGLPLDRFLYCRVERPDPAGMTTLDAGHELLDAWDEVRAKSRWLHEEQVAQLLNTHERIVEAFRTQIGPITEDAIPAAIVLDAEELEETAIEVELEPIEDGN